MAEACPDLAFEVFVTPQPNAPVIPDFFTADTKMHQLAQTLDLSERIHEFLGETVAFGLGSLAPPDFLDSAEGVSDRGRQVGQAMFQHTIGRTAFKNLGDFFFAHAARNKNKRNIRITIPHYRQRRQSIERRQPVIRENQVGRMSPQFMEEFAVCFHSLEIELKPGPGQFVLDQFAVGGVVLNH